METIIKRVEEDDMPPPLKELEDSDEDEEDEENLVTDKHPRDFQDAVYHNLLHNNQLLVERAFKRIAKLIDEAAAAGDDTAEKMDELKRLVRKEGDNIRKRKMFFCGISSRNADSQPMLCKFNSNSDSNKDTKKARMDAKEDTVMMESD